MANRIHSRKRKEFAKSLLSVATVVGAFALMQQYFGDRSYQIIAQQKTEHNLGDYFYLVGGFKLDDILSEYYHLQNHNAIIRRDTIDNNIVVMVVLGKYELSDIVAGKVETGSKSGKIKLRYTRALETPFLGIWTKFQQKGKLSLFKYDKGEYAYVEEFYYSHIGESVTLSKYDSPLPNSVTAYMQATRIRGNWDHVF